MASSPETREHIQKVSKEFEPKLILFAGDSKSDVKLKDYNVITAGRSGKPGAWMSSTRELLKSGADLATPNLARLADPGRPGGTLMLRHFRNLPKHVKKSMLLKRGD